MSLTGREKWFNDSEGEIVYQGCRWKVFPKECFNREAIVKRYGSDVIIKEPIEGDDGPLGSWYTVGVKIDA